MTCPECGGELVEATLIAGPDEVSVFLCDCANPAFADTVRSYRSGSRELVIEFSLFVEAEGVFNLTGYMN
jgi:hypothetical protein